MIPKSSYDPYETVSPFVCTGFLLGSEKWDLGTTALLLAPSKTLGHWRKRHRFRGKFRHFDWIDINIVLTDMQILY